LQPLGRYRDTTVLIVNSKIKKKSFPALEYKETEEYLEKSGTE
jgi:hypothetical protein